MVALWIFIMLGVLQGILEWLPVSSEGQIIFFGNLAGIQDQSLLLSIAFWMHFGTMLSVLVYYRREWLVIINLNNPDGHFMRKFLIITTLATGILGIPIKFFLLESIDAETFGFWIMVILGIALVVTGLLLRYQQSMERGEKELEELEFREIFLIGLAQGLTIIPGVSRSGTTVTAILFSGVNSDGSFRGSFFMSVPAVLGAIALDLLDVITGESTSIIEVDPFGVLLAILVAMVLGIVTMQALIKLAQEVDFSTIVFILAILVFAYLGFLIFVF